VRPIFTLEGLAWAVKNKKAVIVPRSHPWSKPKPAAVLIHQSGARLLRLFEMGMFVYSPKNKKGGRQHGRN